MSVSINWLAVLVAVVSHFAIGFLWYGPLFGKTWMNLVGKTESDLKKGNPYLPFVISFIGATIAAIGLSCLVDLGWQTAWGGAKMAIYVWLAFIATAFFMNDAFEGKPRMLTTLNACFQLSYLVVMGAIIGAWQ